MKKVKQPQPIQSIKDYLPTLKKQMIMTILFPAILLGLLVGSILIITGTLAYTHPLVWILSSGTAALSAGSSLLIFIYTSSPLQDLMKALAHISGEPVTGVIPNPTQEKYKKSGLATALQTMYDLDSRATQLSNKPAEASMLIEPVLDRFHGSIIALNTARTVAYATKDSPLQSQGDELEVRLLFNGSDTLDAWLNECEESSVKAEHIWRRIPDKTADQEDVRIFDVYASYEKGAAYETVLTLIDKTDSYQVDEDDLNFIAFAAHELRGPITVIRGYLDVLQDELSDVLADDQKELFYRLTVSANRLSGYINNILNTAKYDRRHLSVNLVQDTFAAIYNTISDDMALRASSQNRLLSVSIPDNLPAIAADRASLSEVMANLIDNAIKYSNEGGVITVSAKQKGDFIDFTVTDQGIGMPASVVKNLFQKFYRSHRSRETVAGSGIGLYISKAIVESHGGTIAVRSAEGEGSTFTASIPTYASIADKLSAAHNSNEAFISQGRGWIKNHSMFRG